MNATVAACVNRNLLANNANSLGVLIRQSRVLKSEREKKHKTRVQKSMVWLAVQFSLCQISVCTRGRRIFLLRAINVNITYLSCSQKGQQFWLRRTRAGQKRLHVSDRSRVRETDWIHYTFTIKHLIRAVSLGPTPKKKSSQSGCICFDYISEAEETVEGEERRRNKTLRSLHKQRLCLCSSRLWSLPSDGEGSQGSFIVAKTL